MHTAESSQRKIGLTAVWMDQKRKRKSKVNRMEERRMKIHQLPGTDLIDVY